MKLIGLTGKAGAGKDTVADYLVHTLSGTVKMAMAGTLKAMLTAAGLLEPNDRADKERIIPGFTFSWRQAAQRLGTEWGRTLDPEIWLKLVPLKLDVIRAADERIGDDTLVVISDIRFENEADMVRQMGGAIWHIAGREADLGENVGHVSEAGILFYPDQDELIDNRGTLEEDAQVDKLLLEKA